MDKNETLTMRQVCQRLGISASTVRYYCRHGLVPGVRRNRAGYRIFSNEQCDWVQTLEFLRRCGFSLKDLKAYAGLCRKGIATVPERKAMLATKKRQLWQSLEDLQQNIDFIERREELFEAVIQGKENSQNDWL